MNTSMSMSFQPVGKWASRKDDDNRLLSVHIESSNRAVSFLQLSAIFRMNAWHPVSYRHPRFIDVCAEIVSRHKSVLGLHV